MKFVEFDTSQEESAAYKKFSDFLESVGLKVNQIGRARNTKQRHVRINAQIDDIKSELEKQGIKFSQDNVPSLSGKFESFSATFPENFRVSELSGQTLYGLSNLKNKTRVSQKSLTPTKLGFSGEQFKRDELIKTLKQDIPKKVNDETLAEFLLQLVDVAAGSKSQVDLAVMDDIDESTRRIVGIDFGEILAPLLHADQNELIVFPSGNAMLADVEIDGHPISVKSASGSGTSFRAITKYMDQFKQDVKKGNIKIDADEEKVHQFFRAFVDTKGKNVDKIVAASAEANTFEHQKMEKVIGKKNFSYNDLVKFSSKFDSYSEFLKAIWPIATAGGYKTRKGEERPNGMPSDYLYYIGKTDKKPTGKQAGKPAWDANQNQAGANILTYILGTSFLADARKIEKSKKYNNLIKRILDNVQASLVKVDITPDGKIKSSKRPFSELDYEFQYHAPSHIPGNNLPGFSLVLN